MMKSKEPFVVESDIELGMDNRPAVEANFRAILSGHPHYTPGAVGVRWNDPKASVDFGLVLKDGMTMHQVNSEVSKISGNGDCRNRPFPKMLADDIRELLFENGKLRFDKWNEEVARTMMRRWEERELAWSLRLVASKSKVPLDRAIELLQEIMAVEQVMGA